MFLLTHLKAGFEKKRIYRCCDYDDYRPGAGGSACEVPQLRPQDFVSEKSDDSSQAKMLVPLGHFPDAQGYRGTKLVRTGA